MTSNSNLVPASLEAGTTAPIPALQRFERWIVLAVTAVGALLASIQSSALIIAFPTLIVQLNADISTIIWVLLSFLLVCAAVTILTGKLGEIFGQANLFKFGFVTFTVASLLSGFSQASANGYDLVAYRCLMGFGATFLFTNSAAIVTNEFAPFGQVGIAQGVFQLAFAAGSVLGPVVGGGLSVTDWRWIFWLNVPTMGLASIFAIWLIKEKNPSASKSFIEIVRKFDWLGMLFVLGFVVLIMLALTQAMLPSPVLDTPAALTCLVVFGTVCLVAFFLNEQYLAVDPLVDLKMFRNRTFNLSLIAATVVALARGNITYVMIFFLQGPKGQDPLNAGIQLIPFGVGIVIAGFLSGILTDRVGVRNLSVIGPIVAIAGVIGLGLSTGDTDYWLIAFALFVVGIGSGLFNSPNSVAGMLSVPSHERGVAAAVRLLMSFLAQMIGIVITFAFVLNSLSQQELLVLFIYGGGQLSSAAVGSITTALHNVLWITLALFAVGGIASAFISGSFSVRPPVVTKSPNDANAPTKLASSERDSKNVEFVNIPLEDTPKQTALMPDDVKPTSVVSEPVVADLVRTISIEVPE